MKWIKEWLGIDILFMYVKTHEGNIYAANQRIQALENNYDKLNEIILSISNGKPPKAKPGRKPKKKALRMNEGFADALDRAAFDLQHPLTPSQETAQGYLRTLDDEKGALISDCKDVYGLPSTAPID